MVWETLSVQSRRACSSPRLRVSATNASWARTTVRVCGVLSEAAMASGDRIRRRAPEHGEAPDQPGPFRCQEPGVGAVGLRRVRQALTAQLIQGRGDGLPRHTGSQQSVGLTGGRHPVLVERGQGLMRQLLNRNRSGTGRPGLDGGGYWYRSFCSRAAGSVVGASWARNWFTRANWSVARVVSWSRGWAPAMARAARSSAAAWRGRA